MQQSATRPHAFIGEPVHTGTGCFIGHGAQFVNDPFANGDPARGNRTLCRETRIGNQVSTGINATILPVQICDHVVIGAGVVATKNTEEPGIYTGNPAVKLTSIDPIS